MVRKINYTKNGNEYFRVTVSVGRDSNGNFIFLLFSMGIVWEYKK